MALTGGAVRLEWEYRDFDGVLTDPVPSTSLELNIYDGTRTSVTTIASTLVTQLSTGKYRYDYTIPSTETAPLYVEVKGNISGTPDVGRTTIKTSWV